MDFVENIADTMPLACVACHSEQSPEWAKNLIAPRPGLNQPAAGYAGSYRCVGCHEDIYLAWRETLHAKLIQDPAADPAVVVGDFNSRDPDLTFNLDDVAYTIGSRWKQQYLTREGDNFYILPAQWNVETQEWVAPTDNGQRTEWRQTCGTCHVTGLDMNTGGTVEYGLGCESCHGPAAEHAANPTQVKPFAEVDDQVCGACHSRGTSPEGHAFPATYRPGDTLAEHFTFTTENDDIWPDGSAKNNYQQYMDWELGSLMNQADSVSCITCHSPHSRPNTAQLVAPLNDVCLQCHNDKRLVINHIP
jgi:predicted CXXCH cytochrome family protein